MSGIPLAEKYGHYFSSLSKLTKAASAIDETNVYQEENPATRKIMNAMIAENLLPGSSLKNREHFMELLRLVKEGKRGLILMEHYSNTDLPALCALLEQDSPEGKDLAQRIVAIAGMKLNEENPMVKAWAEGFSRIVVYPSRSLKSHIDSQEYEEEKARSRKINMASMRAMDQAKKQGKVILVFPSGTRYRPGVEETKRGLREIDSYLRLFDIMILVSINGNCLKLNPNSPNDMLSDLVDPDVVLMTASPVIECKPFRKEIIASLGENPEDRGIDPKQKTVDAVMEILDKQHTEMEPVQQELYKKVKA